MVNTPVLELEMIPYEGVFLFRCPKCSSTRESNKMELDCRKCKTPMDFQNTTDKWKWEREEIFLTWSQVYEKLTPHKVLEMTNSLLEETFKKTTLVNYIVTKEPHKDGGKHVHAYFKFDRPLRSKNVRLFDIKAYSQEYHPTWVPVRKDRHRLWRYLQKEGAYSAQKDKGYITNMEEVRPIALVIAEEAKSWYDFWVQIMYHPKMTYVQLQAAREIMKFRMGDDQLDDAKEAAKEKRAQQINRVEEIFS